MKVSRQTRRSPQRDEAGDAPRRATRLAPLRKSGKERHSLHASLDDEDDAAAEYRPARESARDYYDDEER